VFYVWFDALIGYMSAWTAKTVAGGPAPDRQGDRAIPRDFLAGVSDGGRSAAAEADFRARVAAVRERQDEQIARNIVRAEPIRQVMGADALRYFLLREIVFGQDGAFSYDALVNRYNSDLANGLGNLASRTLTMIGQYRAGRFRPAERRKSRRWRRDHPHRAGRVRQV